MELTGLSLSQVLTVLGIAGGLTVVLYLLKLRRRRVDVPFVRLWEKVLAEKQTTRRFSQLKRLLSLLIALAIVAALAFALGDPRYAGATAEGRTLVVLVDASASMKATDVVPSRFDAAKQEVERLIAELGPADRMLVAQLDASATPVSPMSDEPRVLKASLDRLRPTDIAASLRAGLHLGLDVLRGTSDPELVLITDGGLGRSPELERRLTEEDVRLSWIAVGTADENVGVSAFSVRRYPLDKSQSEVLVELWNPTEDDRVIELELLGDGEPVDLQRLTVQGGERLRRFFENVSGVDKTLEARVRPVDALPDHLGADDRAYARLPERRRARVLVVSPGNLYLQAALLLDEYLDVSEVTPAQYPVEGRYDVIIFDAWVPPTTPDTSALYLYPISDDPSRGPFEVEGGVKEPWFDTLDRQHPLLRFTALGDVNIAEALEVKLQQGDRAIGRFRDVPLMVTGTRDGKRFVSLNFDLRQSDLPLRIAWPLLLLNTIDWFVQEEAGYVSSYATGDTWHVPVPAGLERATIVDPAGNRREVAVEEGRAVFAGDEAGFYTLEAPDGDQVFAANLGPGAESDIAPAESLEVGGQAAGEVSHGEVGVRQEIWIYLVLAVMAILAVEWFTYHRRWTV